MAQLIVRNLEERVVAVLRQRAARRGVSMEEEHRTILRAALVNVFLTPATMDELERRLRNRATDSEEVIQRRLAAAREELAQWNRFDYLILSQTPQDDLRRLQVIVDAEGLQPKSAARVDEDRRRRPAHVVGAHRLRHGFASGVGRIHPDRKTYAVLMEKGPKRLNLHPVVVLEDRVQADDREWRANEQLGHTLSLWDAA